MDLYHYFNPHFNPRLLKIPLRLQEIDELKQATVELRKAIKRSNLRNNHGTFADSSREHFHELQLALDYAVDLFSALSNSHPGDDTEMLARIIEERAKTPGWENWVRLAQERLDYLKNREIIPVAANSTK